MNDTNMMMMALMIGMTNRSNPAETVQTVIGASSALGEGGRMAVGLMRQQQVETERVLAKRNTTDRLKAVGDEFHALVHELEKRGTKVEFDKAKYPALWEAVQLALPGHAMGGTGSGSGAGASSVSPNQEGRSPMTKQGS